MKLRFAAGAAITALVAWVGLGVNETAIASELLSLDDPRPLKLTLFAEAASTNASREIMTKGAQEFGFSVGAAIGMKPFAGSLDHNLGVTSIRYGRVMTRLLGEGEWWQGNWEFLGELFLGGQYDPKPAYLVGAMPWLRYNFVASERWRPFLEAGSGPGCTDIGGPDLGGKFQFNNQGGGGIQYFWDDHHALTAQCRFMHVSNGGLARPNRGVNGCVFFVGSSWFF